MCFFSTEQIHYSAIYATLLPFAVLDYDPPTAEEFFDVCVQHFTPYISTTFPTFFNPEHYLINVLNSFLIVTGSLDPHLLVLLAYALAMADYFPEDVIREIFTVDFLAKLDAQLESTLTFYSLSGFHELVLTKIYRSRL